jgi:hypothetical protein
MTFMNEFNLYRMANIDAEQMINPMKRTALLLGFIKGPNVKDWVRLRTDEMIARYNLTGNAMDEAYWDQVGQEFMQAFQDTAARERAEEKLKHLTFIPGDVDTFVAQFRTLADEAMYPLNAKPTISLFASKLPFKMMEHIYKITRPGDFNGWANAARQYHQDNTAVQNMRGFMDEYPKKVFKKKGYTRQQWAQLLGIKLPTPKEDAMDTRADRSRSFNKNKGTQGRVSATKEDPELQRKEGRCYTCNRQGHLARNCPKKGNTKPKEKAKGRQAETEESQDETSDEETTFKEDLTSFVKKARTKSEETRLEILDELVKEDFA